MAEIDFSSEFGQLGALCMQVVPAFNTRRTEGQIYACAPSVLYPLYGICA